VIVLGLLITLGMGQVRSRRAAEALEESVSGTGSPTAWNTSPTTTMSAIEGLAVQDMVGEMQRVQGVRKVDRVPEIWLEGVYLSGASGYPEVSAFWSAYQAYVREMRTLESELFRRNLVRRLGEEGLSETMISIQLARALRAFADDRPRREGAYASHIELASAPLALHDFLVKHENEISYAPARTGLSRDPVTEAVPETPEIREEMNRRLDRVLSAMERANGERVSAKDDLPFVLHRTLSLVGESGVGG
jgi:hypothetical protein